ncbi:MAG: DUF2141 domain-containing protein [Caulobacterales bacterium]
MKVRTLLAIALLFASSFSSPSAVLAAETCVGNPEAGAVRLEVKTVGLRNDNGLVAVTLYPDNKKRFLAPKGKLFRQRVHAALPVTKVCFLIPPGSYAVAVYHDENENRDFDRNAVGLPAEGFGFSQNPATQFGLPKLHEARFTVPEDGSTITVQMRYR